MTENERVNPLGWAGVRLADPGILGVDRHGGGFPISEEPPEREAPPPPKREPGTTPERDVPTRPERDPSTPGEPDPGPNIPPFPDTEPATPPQTEPPTTPGYPSGQVQIASRALG